MASQKLHDVIDLPFAAGLVADRPSTPVAIQERVLALFDECGPRVRRYVASFNLGDAATDDVVQEVFLALFRHLSLGRPATNLNGWLFQVAHNLALKQRQHTVRRSLVEGTWDAASLDHVADARPNPEQRLAERQRQRHLLGVLRLMPERDKQCVYLRAEGLCYREIAKTLGVSLGSVAKSIVRAIGRLSAADME
ncbi:MAG: sigma-70 family RNA polymerase sigma factor [Acidobacteria bacterium]|nr:sigma-70 family RNA polymerase sigma factor [Acidobacteriota bacterium]